MLPPMKNENTSSKHPISLPFSVDVDIFYYSYKRYYNTENKKSNFATNDFKQISIFKNHTSQIIMY